MRSSYIQNNYGNVFRALILAHLPRLVVECGVLDGYSTFNIAHALRFNKTVRNIDSSFVAYDLWEGYEYKHGDFQKVANMLHLQGLLNKYVNLHYGNAFEVNSNFQDRTVDFLHMDISNDGEVLEKTIDLWGPKISQGGIIAFEGGSIERDEIEWMKEFDKKPIHPMIANLKIFKYWGVQIFTAFPSMTLLFKR